MKIKHTDIIINEDNPFANCKLDRLQYAKILTNIISSYSDGFVLAINNEWGTGKTTFVKMWQQYLNNESYKTIYFNAWENDFDLNPIVAIMSELKALSNSSNKELYKSVLQKGAVLSKKILPALLKSLSKKYLFDSDIIIDAIENTAEAATEILEEEIKEYTDKKQTVREFREELEKFVEKVDNNKPILFIIDELDRCRPSYAVELLEQMKHFFSVKGIVFVLSIDKTQLSHAIKGVYGSDRINSDEYLRRFIDLEYSIPFPSIEKFCKYLYDYYSFDDIFKERRKHSEFASDDDSLLRISTMLFTKDNATLRQQEKIYGFTRLVLSSFKHNYYIFPDLFFVLIYMKVTKPELYIKIRNQTIALQDLSNGFTGLFPTNLYGVFDVNLLYIEAELLHFYNNQRDYYQREKLIEADENRNNFTSIKSRLDMGTGQTSLIECLVHVSSSLNCRDIKLSYLLNKIDLLESININ